MWASERCNHDDPMPREGAGRLSTDRDRPRYRSRSLSSNPSVVHPEVPKRPRRALRPDAEDRLSQVARVDHRRCPVIVDHRTPDKVLALVSYIVPIVRGDLLEPRRVDVSAQRRIVAEPPVEVVIGVEHYGAESDHVVQTLEIGR